MIKHLMIRYRGANATLNCTPVTVLIGPTGSGKTSIIDAIGFLNAFVTHGFRLACAERNAGAFQLAPDGETFDIALVAALPEEVGLKSYDSVRYAVAFNDAGVLTETLSVVGGNKVRIIAERSHQQAALKPCNRQNRGSCFGVLVDRDKTVLRSFPDDRGAYPVPVWMRQLLKSLQYCYGQRCCYDYAAKNFLALPQDAYDRWIECLRQIIPDLRRIRHNEDLAMDYRVPLVFERDGYNVMWHLLSSEEQFLSYVTLIAMSPAPEPANGIWLFDNFDSGLDAGWLWLAWQSIQDFPGQVIIACNDERYHSTLRNSQSDSFSWVRGGGLDPWVVRPPRAYGPDQSSQADKEEGE